MATIINNQDFILTPAQQQAVQNACAHANYSEIITGEKFEDEDGEILIPFYFDSYNEVDDETIEEFAFNMNAETLEII